MRLEAKTVKAYLVTFVAIFLGNMILHGFLLRGWNDAHLAGITNREGVPPMQAMLLDYLILNAALLYLIKNLAPNKDPKKSFLIGAFFGGILFLHIGLSNVFLLPVWPLAVIPTDTIASAIAFGLAGVVANKFLTK